MKSKALIFLIVLQVILIFNLASNILKRLDKRSINTISKSNIANNSRSKLHYFYEPIAGTVQTVKKDWLPEAIHYSINNDTLNERFDYALKKEKGTYRIITLGDSFTYGLNVSTNQNWTELLEDELNKRALCKGFKKYEVINLGVEGYDTEYEVERYRLRGIKYDPDLVIWTVSDFERILEKMKPLITPITDEEKDRLAQEGKFYKNWVEARSKVIQNIGMNGVLTYQGAQIKRFDDYYHGKLIYILYPMDESYYDLFRAEIKSQERKRLYHNYLLLGDSNQYLLPDRHFNKEGNKKVMEMTLQYLMENVPFACNIK